MANRHGIISGATGSGKTVTLQVLAEGFSRIGVPVFLADIKGDLSGIAVAGFPGDQTRQRLNETGVAQFQARGNPVLFWDLFGQSGHPVRTTISDLGPLLLSSLLELNDTQTGVLYSAFKIADNDGLLLLDLKDLRALLAFMSENSRELKGEYGNFSSASIGAIQRQLLILEEQGAENFFGEPSLQLNHLMQTDFSGNGVVNVLDARRLSSESPRLYATFLLWLLSEIYETLPEVGDSERPKLVLFFDEAHLLFDRAPRPLSAKIEQVVRLVRSKGVGIFFITQSPLDIPEEILGQLGLRIQHVLRAFTPKDRKTVRSVAGTFRENPAIDSVQCITELGIGEALVSTLARNGTPTPVQRILIRPPESQIGQLDGSQRSERLLRSPLVGVYETAIDRESAYELLQKRAESVDSDRESGRTATISRRSRQSVGETLLKSAARSIGSQVGRQLIRGLMGSLLGRGGRSRG
ncbi:MAG: helicase HerA-like domain-containing protein [Gammaproteobacteria bacterium]